MESRCTFRKFMSSVMLDWENSPLSWEGTKTSWWDGLCVLWEDVFPRNIPQLMLTFIEYILPQSLVPWLLCFHLMKGSLGMVTFIFWHKMTYEKNTPIVHRALRKVVLGVETVLFNLEFFQAGGDEGKEVWGRAGGKREGRKGGWKRSVPCGCLSPAGRAWEDEQYAARVVCKLQPQGTNVALENHIPLPRRPLWWPC